MMRSLMLVVFLSACSADRPGCLDSPNNAACVPASPCNAYNEQCEPQEGVQAFVITDGASRPKGVDAMAAIGDFVLQNAFITAVIDAPDRPTNLSISGGNLLDLAPRGGTDHLVQVSHGIGILPRDQVQYTSVEIGESTPDSASLIARGFLFGDDRILVFTRYELRTCDRAIRMRTEIYNGGRIAQTMFLTDAYFWGDRSVTPFYASPQGGFVYPPLDLLTIEKAFRSFPFMSAESHTGNDDGSFATVACDRRELQGFNTTTLSAAGTARNVILPGDGFAFERMMFVAEGAGSSAAQALAMRARQPLFGERSITVRGRVSFAGDLLPSGNERDATLIFYEGEEGTGIPWAQAVPSADGRYEVQLPVTTDFSVTVHSFGRPVQEPVSFSTQDSDVDLDFTDLQRPATLQVSVNVDAELILVPFDSDADVSGSLHGNFATCAPYLGAPHGKSPACNRVLAPNGAATFSVPPGDYWVYATHGFTYSLARERVQLGAGTSAHLSLTLLPLGDVQPPASLSADFHMHGGRSFDTSIPDFDRVTSFLTSGVQVVAATDHDVVGSYDEEIARLGYGSRMFVMPGVEMTGLVLFYKREGSIVPRTLGHFNFWPMTYDPTLPRNGAPWDELQEPGELYDVMAPLIGVNGVMQLNHPYSESKLGRDEGYATAIGYDVRVRVPETATSKPEGQWRRTFKNHDNLGHNVQEVMNGSSIVNFLQYRALWYSFLRQGILRAGTANSDSHTLNIEQAGYPRNIVLGSDFGFADFGFPNVDVASFNAAVREGRMVGTNGPMITADLQTANGRMGPSIIPVVPSPGAVIRVKVAAAPWIPVTELRVFVNGELVRTVLMSAMSTPTDPFGTAGTLRYEGEIALSELLSADGFVTFEAGLALPEAADIEEPLDGVVDALDFNSDGVVNEKDLETDRRFPAERAKEGDVRRHIDVVSPGTWPTAFTNPFIVDLDGNGYVAGGL